MTDKLTFFITVNKLDNKVIIREGNIVNIEIPKN